MSIRVASVFLLLVGVSAASLASAAGPETLNVRLRSRVEAKNLPGRYALVEKAETWNLGKTAIIVCDMWDLHHCLNAVRRGTEMAPTMDKVLKTARDRGAVIIHAPSECMASYEGNPARARAIATPKSKSLPKEIGIWCRKIPSEEKGVYPIDQTDGGEDDDLAEHQAWASKLAGMGRNPKAPWKSQMDLLHIDTAKDYISDKGEEIWSILEERQIENVVLLGVHLNMCVLGRPFGLRQMAKNGKHVVLMRDMTDTMYNPERSPKVSHYAGTDLMVEHVEKFVCPTLTSDQFLGGTPFRFQGDKRPDVAVLIADDEYRTEVTLPEFASTTLLKDARVTFLLESQDRRDSLPGMAELKKADLLLVSARRRVLPKEQVEILRDFVASGKPVVGIRTASHAFAAKVGAKVPEGRATWDRFDPEVLGGNYHGHHKEGNHDEVSLDAVADSPLLSGVNVDKLKGHGSLYKVSPLVGEAKPILRGTIKGEAPEPVAWTFESPAHGRVFYTSLGHIGDFDQPDFKRLLQNAIQWALGTDKR